MTGILRRKSIDYSFVLGADFFEPVNAGSGTNTVNKAGGQSVFPAAKLFKPSSSMTGLLGLKMGRALRVPPGR